jgi:hypothetical protein
MAMNLRSAVSKINQRGMLLVFPVKNAKQPASLWSEFFPRTEMRWEWDDSGDNRVGELWHLRAQLSTSRKVVYTKWYRGRATVISFELFTAMLKILDSTHASGTRELSLPSRELLDLLEEDSPLSTKVLKKAADLRGKDMERVYNAAMKPLWAQLLVIAFGEVDEGAFPSLAMGATKVIFEDLWRESEVLKPAEALKTVERLLPRGTPFRKYFDEVAKKTAAARAVMVN